METHCPICKNPKKEVNKFCSYKCRNIYINSRKDYSKQAIKLSESLIKYNEERLGPILVFNVVCDTCKNTFEVLERQNKFPTKDIYYCSIFCAKTRKMPEDEKLNRSLSRKPDSISGEDWIKRRNKKGTYSSLSKEEKFKIRSEAGKKAVATKIKNGQIKYDKSILKDYRLLCRFVFKLRDFPEEFDLSLYQKYGTYRAKNYGDNQTGIVRDHMYSVKEGFKNNVDPYLLSHPANCNLIRGNDNQHKHTKCTITLEELKERVEKWNEKYGPYPNDRANHLQ